MKINLRKIKPQTLPVLLIATVILIIGCKRDYIIDDRVIEPELSIVGEWKYEYEILRDGTKELENPYAILEFEYSDGFILKENGTGNSLWNNSINGDFEWTDNGFKLKVSVERADNHIDQFEYNLSNLTENSMEFETPKGHKYLMIKQ